MKGRVRASSVYKRAKYPRDMVGYGRRLPDPKWPGGARLALQISLNYEAGGELNVLHGDRVSEAMLTDIGFPAVKSARSPLVESSFEYGSRRGVWRLLRLFEERKIVFISRNSVKKQAVGKFFELASGNAIDTGSLVSSLL